MICRLKNRKIKQKINLVFFEKLDCNFVKAEVKCLAATDNLISLDKLDNVERHRILDLSFRETGICLSQIFFLGATKYYYH